MAEAKGGAEIWVAGIGRKSNAQYGSDLMVEVLRELGIKYIALNPGASYRGLHDSLVNFESGKGPEMIMCTHEEIAVALANGYARATGQIMATGKNVITKMEFSDTSVRIYGNTALVKCRVDLWHSDTNIVHMNILHAWVKGSNGWQLVARQATRLE